MNRGSIQLSSLTPMNNRNKQNGISYDHKARNFISPTINKREAFFDDQLETEQDIFET